MPIYCVNSITQPGSGDHEVHDLASPHGCLPDARNRVNLGPHPSCVQAVAAARKIYKDVNGCYYCARPCHTT